MRVADVFGIDAQRERIGQLKPPTEVRLDLLAVRIVLAHLIFAEPRAAMTDREGIALDLQPAAKPDRVALLVTRDSLLITHHSLLITRY